MGYSRELSEIAASVTVDSSKNITIPEKITVAKDSTISGLTVGKGGGSVNTNTAVGQSALNGTATGTNNTAVGNTAMAGSTVTGSANSAFGSRSLYSQTSGNYNSAIGEEALYSNTTGSSNTALGFASLLLNTTGNSNTGLGQDSLRNNTTASNNTAVGYQAGYSTTTGAACTFIGNVAGYSNTTGVNNTMVGYGAGYLITTGSKNSVLGLYNGNQGGLDIRTASNYIVLSDGDGNPRQIIDGSGNIQIGTATIFDAGVRMTVSLSAINYFLAGINTGSSPYGMTIRYPNASPNGGGNEFIDCQDSTALRFRAKSNGGLSNYQANNTNLSDAREKKNIELAGNYLDKICAIPVKTFLYNDQTDDDLNLGVIAQDVQAIAPELVSEDDWGTKDEPKMRLSIYQTDLQYALMKAIQELKAEFDLYKATHP